VVARRERPWCWTTGPRFPQFSDPSPGSLPGSGRPFIIHPSSFLERLLVNTMGVFPIPSVSTLPSRHSTLHSLLSPCHLYASTCYLRRARISSEVLGPRGMDSRAHARSRNRMTTHANIAATTSREPPGSHRSSRAAGFWHLCPSAKTTPAPLCPPDKTFLSQDKDSRRRCSQLSCDRRAATSCFFLVLREDCTARPL
jgi:hypothetical protein